MYNVRTTYLQIIAVQIMSNWNGAINAGSISSLNHNSDSLGKRFTRTLVTVEAMRQIFFYYKGNK